MSSPVSSPTSRTRWPRASRATVCSLRSTARACCSWAKAASAKARPQPSLLKRGHRLIADDAVEIRKVAGNTLRGTSPELIRNYIEIRGIGVINVAKLFGMAAIKDESTVDLVVNIVPVGNEQIFDRLGLEEQYMDLLGVKVPAITIPVRPGRNLAIILEVAAMNNRQKKMGYNAAAEFTEQINRHFDETAGQSF